MHPVAKKVHEKKVLTFLLNIFVRTNFSLST